MLEPVAKLPLGDMSCGMLAIRNLEGFIWCAVEDGSVVLVHAEAKAVLYKWAVAAPPALSCLLRLTQLGRPGTQVAHFPV